MTSFCRMNTILFLEKKNYKVCVKALDKLNLVKFGQVFGSSQLLQLKMPQKNDAYFKSGSKTIISIWQSRSVTHSS